MITRKHCVYTHTHTHTHTHTQVHTYMCTHSHAQAHTHLSHAHITDREAAANWPQVAFQRKSVMPHAHHSINHTHSLTHSIPHALQWLLHTVHTYTLTLSLLFLAVFAPKALQWLWYVGEAPKPSIPTTPCKIWKEAPYNNTRLLHGSVCSTRTCMTSYACVTNNHSICLWFLI